jgi:hypothetical protein
LETRSFWLQKAVKKPNQKITKKLQCEPPIVFAILSLWQLFVPLEYFFWLGKLKVFCQSFYFLFEKL